eukprot:TRINITY_DN3308_c0_g4_i1.p1 TRINITY_DN3308_c0_g4~~TRINITY_DN3308_c0_g4_i1.p1  ORF type:complete len:198 (+),score=27.88 TRINITY_DN3308_c0_g4_i1:841-1434(+)
MPSPKYECSKEIASLVQNHLPFLWERKLPRYSTFYPWAKVLAFGFPVMCFLIAVGPGLLLGIEVSPFLQWLLTIIIIAAWLFSTILAAFCSARYYFAITEKGLLKIEKGWRGARVQSLPFGKVYPISTGAQHKTVERIPAVPDEPVVGKDIVNLRHRFPEHEGFFLAGSAYELIQREEIIFRKYLDTLKEVNTVENV